MRDFVHLHVHSHYSLLDATCRVEDLVARATALGMRALALTDHGGLFGAFELCKQAKQAGVKPIPGIETCVASGGHLLLLAKDRVGLRNLMRLSSEAFLHGVHGRPSIDRGLLARHGDGLIGLSACIRGEVPSAVLAGEPRRARELAAVYRDIFAPGDFYLEVMDPGTVEGRRVTEALASLSWDLGLPVVATNNVHYMDPGDAEARDVLTRIRGQDPGPGPVTGRLHFRTEDEMRSLFPDHPEWVLRTREVAEKVDVSFETGVYHLPRFVPEDGSTPEAYLGRLCEEGLSRRYPAADARHRERLDYEVKVIEEMGCVSYFLIVQDFMNWARRQGIPVGPRRGSAPGSIVAYCLGITGLDPLRYDLIFERFLNPGRVSMPDIDVDVCQDGRLRVIDYVRRKYGEENVTQIITFGSLKAKLVVRDVGRVLGHPLSETDRLAEMIPDRATLGHALETVPEFKAAYEGDPAVRRILDTARKLEGLARHLGTHAAGVIISDAPVTDYVPLYKGEKGVSTQFPMDQVEELGLVKMDFLGLRDLTIIDRAVRLVREVHGVELDVLGLDLADPKTFGLFSRGETRGVFQFESEGMRNLLVQARPDRLEDLIALNALYRPGPMDLVPSFCARKHGREPVSYPHPATEAILRETYGIIVYQEQVMRIAHELAGFSLGDAEQLRKAMGKKEADLMARFEPEFLRGCRERNGIPEPRAREIWDLLVRFAAYAFNKSHSAAYALVAYQTGYLKANYPVEYMAALISCELCVEHIAEARSMDVEVLPPDVNRGAWKLTVSSGSIRLGLDCVQDVDADFVRSILKERERGGEFRSLDDLLRRTWPRRRHRRTLRRLVEAGAMDSLGDRAWLHRTVRRSWRPLAPSTGQLIADTGAWTPSERLAHERKALGFYLSGHPLDAVGAEPGSV